MRTDNFKTLSPPKQTRHGYVQLHAMTADVTLENIVVIKEKEIMQNRRYITCLDDETFHHIAIVDFII